MKSWYRKITDEAKQIKTRFIKREPGNEYEEVIFDAVRAIFGLLLAAITKRFSRVF